MPYKIALNFEDGVTRFIECKDRETVLDAAYRAQVNLPMDCSDGVCGTCKCRAESGEFDLGADYLDEALTREEAAEGYVLTCQMVPSSDCVIAVPTQSSALNLKPATHGAQVVAADRVSESTIVLSLDIDDDGAVNFLPGQYVNIGVPETGAKRSYSFSSAPGDKRATFLIRNIPGGVMSDWLTGKAAAGDRIEFVGPQGSFYLRNVERPILLLAGGTGLAPILSMMEVLAERGTDQPVTLIYGVTRDVDLAGVERIKALSERISNFGWKVCVAEDGSAQPLKGFVTQHTSDADLNGGDVDIYLCGPPPMVEAVRRFLKEKAVSPKNFHYEKFNPSGEA